MGIEADITAKPVLCPSSSQVHSLFRMLCYSPSKKRHKGFPKSFYSHVHLSPIKHFIFTSSQLRWKRSWTPSLSQAETVELERCSNTISGIGFSFAGKAMTHRLLDLIVWSGEVKHHKLHFSRSRFDSLCWELGMFDFPNFGREADLTLEHLTPVSKRLQFLINQKRRLDFEHLAP